MHASRRSYRATIAPAIAVAAVAMLIAGLATMVRAEAASASSLRHAQASANVALAAPSISAPRITM